MRHVVHEYFQVAFVVVVVVGSLFVGRWRCFVCWSLVVVLIALLV